MHFYYPPDRISTIHPTEFFCQSAVRYKYTWRSDKYYEIPKGFQRNSTGRKFGAFLLSSRPNFYYPPDRILQLSVSGQRQVSATELEESYRPACPNISHSRLNFSKTTQYRSIEIQVNTSSLRLPCGAELFRKRRRRWQCRLRSCRFMKNCRRTRKNSQIWRRLVWKDSK